MGKCSRVEGVFLKARQLENCKDGMDFVGSPAAKGRGGELLADFRTGGRELLASTRTGGDCARTNGGCGARRVAVASAVMGYSVPRLHTGRQWYVDFVQFDPLTGGMRRKKYSLDGIKGARARRQRGAELIATLSAKLGQGWNVWADGADDVRAYASIDRVRGLWLEWMERMVKSGVLRRSSADRKGSFAKVFFDWLGRDMVHGVRYVYQLTTGVLDDFLDWLLLDREVLPVTRNNYRTWLVTFCEWLREKRFLTTNVALELKVLPEGRKLRRALTGEELGRLRGYLVGRDKWFLLACMLEYYCFIRPTELTHVRVGDVSAKGLFIRLSGEWTKNGRDARVGLNVVVRDLMLELGVLGAPADCFLFGGKDLRPGRVLQSGRVFRDRWLKVRRALRWGDDLQFYSLKDSGIRDLANAEGIVVARDQARHSDVSTTNLYLKGDALRVHEETKRFRGFF